MESLDGAPHIAPARPSVHHAQCFATGAGLVEGIFIRALTLRWSSRAGCGGSLRSHLFDPLAAQLGR